MKRTQQGLGAVAIIAILVVLAVLAASIMRLGTSTGAAIGNDVAGARASQAAYAGTQWGLYQALRGSWTTCSGATQTLDLTSDYGMHVSLSCNSSSYTEGSTALRVFTIEAVACNAATCPDNTRAVQPNYVERKLQVQVTN